MSEDVVYTDVIFVKRNKVDKDNQEECHLDGGHLVIINSRDEQGVPDRNYKKNEESFWIGLTDEEIEDNGYGYWTRAEPDNWKGNRGEYPSGEDCAHIYKNSIQDLKGWFDAVCNKAFRRICDTRSSRQT